MKWWRLFLGLLILETLGLLFFNIHVGSQPDEQVIFNLSPMRFLLTFGIGSLVICLGYILIRSFRNNNLAAKFIKNESQLITLISFSFIQIIISLLILCVNPGNLDRFRQLYQNLKPFLVWSFGTGLQTLLFSLVWYCHLFVGNAGNEDYEKYCDELLFVLAIFLALVLVKEFFVIPTAYGPVIPGDEIRYFELSKELFNGVFSIAKTNHSPYLYPAMLSVSFIWGDKAYSAIKLLNIIYSSSIVFPLFLIARKYFSKIKALLISLSSCVLSYHLLFPRMVMSENLYFPLLLWTIFFILNKPRNSHMHWFWHLAAGISLGLLNLTRYITLAIIPPLILSWLYINREDCYHHRQSFFANASFHLCVFISGILLGDSPWIISGIKAGVPIDILLGFEIASQTTPNQLTLHNLFIWLLLYICYLLLMAAPVLPYFSYLFNSRFKDWNIQTRQWMVLLCALIAGFLAACVRHSWRALYNDVMPSRIMGRYVLYFTPLFLVSALLLVRQQNSLKHTSFTRHLFRLGIIPFSLVALAYAILFGNLFHLHDGNLIKILGSVDGAYFQILGSYFFIFLFTMYIAIVWLTWVNLQKQLKWISFGLFITFYLVGVPAYYQELVSYQNFQYIGNTIIQIHRSGKCDLSNMIQILTPPGTPDREQALMFNTIYFNNYKALYVTNINDISSESISQENGVQNVVISELQDSEPQENSYCRIIEFNQQKYVLNY